MALYNRVFTEGLQRLRRQGKVTLDNMPERHQRRLERYTIPRVRADYPGNWPTKVSWKSDPKLDYKIASHKVRSMNSPVQQDRRTPEEIARYASPQPKSKGLKRRNLLLKRKELQAKLKSEREREGERT
jgi:hypothetical protein